MGLYEEIAASPLREKMLDIIDRDLGGIEPPDFLCFDEFYFHLSKIIPKGRTIIDLGCCYAFQSWYFRDHKRYIGVDLLDPEDVFLMENGHYYQGTIDRFIDGFADDARNVFAICNYVLTNTDLLRQTFRNLFVFYPEYGDKPELDSSLDNLNKGRKV